MRDKLIQIIREELSRQADISEPGGLFLYNEEENETGVDGRLHIDQLAEAIERGLHANIN